MKEIRLLTRPMTLTCMVVASSLCNLFAATKTCSPSSHCSVPVTVDCDTYDEILVVDATHGDPVWHTDPIGSATAKNCGSEGSPPFDPLNGSYDVAYSISESISHSCVGSLKTEVGAKVGVDAVAAVSLSAAYTLANGWQQADTYTSTTSVKWNFSVPACLIHKVTVYGDWVTGEFSGSGYWHSWYFDNATGWENTDCLQTASSATPVNKVYVGITISGEGVSDCDPCYTGG